MIYRVYTKKDTFITSEPTITGQYRDAGRDPILEISQYPDVNNITRYKWNLNKTKANAYLISAFHHLKSDRFIISLEFIRRAINFYPKILFKKH